MSVKNVYDLQRLPEVIRKTRKIAGLSQQQLAEMAEIGKATVFEVEKGKNRISFDKLLKILKVLNIKLEINPPVQISDDQ